MFAGKEPRYHEANRPCTAIAPSNASRLPALPSTAAALLDAFLCTCTHDIAQSSALEASSTRELAAEGVSSMVLAFMAMESL